MVSFFGTFLTPFVIHRLGRNATYFVGNTARAFDADAERRIRETFLRAYRYQFILSGVERTRFPVILGRLVPAAEAERVVKVARALT